MLRKCKVDVVVLMGAIYYDEITKSKEDYIMNLSEKIVKLRKMNGWSQEELADKLNVSRQAISRWEGGTAQPDATNILSLSKLFGVSTDYLLNDEYESDRDIPIVQAINKEKEDLVLKKKQLHLISGICFAIATVAALIGVVNSINQSQLGISCFLLTLCVVNTVIQFSLYFKRV